MLGSSLLSCRSRLDPAGTGPVVHCLRSSGINTSTGDEAALIHVGFNDAATGTPSYADIAALVKQRWTPLVVSEVPLPSLWKDPIPCDRGKLPEAPYGNANMTLTITTAAATTILIFSFDERGGLHDLKALTYRATLLDPPRRGETSDLAQTCEDARH
jgi:hypothetical protein